ncbi:uncharacterized protein LOC132727398 isoform X2 [Ruditapes philippinarum]|uniref:uncharacterized protein LOC132727398 isoform X2 n=1 Tax=Ruditapes philippinarum TaxID=129788 RepID=UPI00295B95CD|nr:uncharacterized protein LOC132727398 isoform X2 [Ruditapes philippinarum]
MSEERSSKLQRRKAMKRRTQPRGNRSGELSKIAEPLDNSQSDSSGEDEQEKGPSIDLTPTLLGIYDKIASANDKMDKGPDDQSEVEYFVTNDSLEDGSDNQCHSPKSSPLLSRHTIIDQSKFRELLNQPNSANSEVENKFKKNRVRVDSEHRNPVDLDEDNKKRPLSISSMSSSSTSSLPRRRKRPNLSEYVESPSSSQLDIEKLDNILYIDDNIEEDGHERSAEELSVSSEDKGKSGGDSESHSSVDHSINESDQPELLKQERSLSLDQSNTNLSFTSANSANSSTADISSLTSDQKSVDSNSEGEKVRRSPSRSSQKSIGMSRSTSLKQQAHYVSYVQRVVTELVETERTYVWNLQDIKQGYYQHIADSKTLNITVQERECLFGNILEIYNFSRHFLSELEDCGMDPIKVAGCFLKNSEGFVIYAHYCTNYPSAVAVLTKVMCDPHLNSVFKQRQLALNHSLPLGAYLLKPVQRVLKYHLLLQNILKHYSKKDPGHDKLVSALNHMTNMSHQINEMKRKHEHAVRVQEIQSQLEDYEGEDFTMLGELVLEGSFRMFGVKASRQLFLFEKGVIIAKRKEDGMLSCKAVIPCNQLMLVESIPKEPLNFQIIPFDNPKAAHIIHARNLDQKRKWCQEIKRLILESYSKKIPDNVKDLIIEKLGKSKEDELVQAGTADSGKSHVSTPDYLEKRLRARRKSGSALISEILRPQKNRRAQQAKSKSESPILKPQPLESLMYTKNKYQENNGYRTPSGLARGSKVSKQEENQENWSPNRAAKRPVSIQRSRSFQTSSIKSPSPEPYLKEKSNVDSMSMDNLSQSDGPALRTNSFRLATRVSPIRFDSVDGARILQSQDEGEENVKLNGDIQKLVDNMRPSVRKSIDDIDGGGNKSDQYFREKTSNGESHNFDGSYLDDLSSPKRSRYASMPVLNTIPSSSPRTSRLSSERSAYSPTMNHLPRSSIHHAKRIDIKPYFSCSRDKINQISSSPAKNKENDLQSLTKDQKHVNAFNDTFSHIRKSQENLCDKTGEVPKPLSLTQPKPFTSTLKSSASVLQSQARLNKWGQERFIKGSMSDLSHLKDDPWVRNKQRSYTETKLTLDAMRNKSPKVERSPSKQTNRKIDRLSLDNNNPRHLRTQSFNGEDTMASNNSLDWIVYANRNSLPVSGLASEEIGRKYKFCTPPRGVMDQTQLSKYSDAEMMKTPQHRTAVASHSTPINTSSSSYSNHSSGQETDFRMNESSISLSATNTSSETCSSPDILKDGVFDDNGLSEKFFPRERAQVSRSFSSPGSDYSPKLKRQHHEDRPASADILGDGMKESEKLIAEMEHYLKRSTSSSGSLSSSNSKFPTNIPNFEKKNENKNYNRNSVLSTGSASSYESTSDFKEKEEQEEGLVDSIKNKISSITSKLTGKKSVISQSQISKLNETSPRFTPEDHPNKINNNLSLRIKPGQHRSGKLNLPSLLKESELGSEAIGSRMANTDLDDYATFSLPQDAETTESKQEGKQLHYGRFSSASLTGFKLNQIQSAKSKQQSQSESKLYHPVANLKNVAQSDSAFSIQSADNDSSSTEDSPRRGESHEGRESPGQDKDSKESSGTGTFYERRFSEVFNNDEAFRDSAVYCDDIDSPPAVTQKKTNPLPPTPTVNIKCYISQLEEKNKQKMPPPVKVRQKEPSATIKQRMESLTAHSEYRNKSSSTSRSMSTATSRTQSCSSSRAVSEERQLTGSALQEYIVNKFPTKSGLETFDDCSFRSRSGSSSRGGGRMKAAFSTGRLDLLSMDVDNLVIMKGWVKELVKKFQDEK